MFRLDFNALLSGIPIKTIGRCQLFFCCSQVYLTSCMPIRTSCHGFLSLFSLLQLNRIEIEELRGNRYSCRFIMHGFVRLCGQFCHLGPGSHSGSSRRSQQMVGLCLPFSRGFCGQKEKLRRMFCRCTFVTDQGHPLAKECVNVNVSIFVEVRQTVCWYLSRKTNEMSSLIQQHLFKRDAKSVPGFDA